MAADVGKGVILRARLDRANSAAGSVSLTLQGGFAEIDVQGLRADRGCEIRLLADARLLVSAGTTWTLGGVRTPVAVDLEVRGEHPATSAGTAVKSRGVNATLRSLSVESPGAVRVGVPIAPGALVNAKGGDLSVQTAASGLHVLANSVSFSRDVNGGCFHLTGKLQAPRLIDVQVTSADEVIADSGIDRSRILRCNSVAAGSLRGTHIFRAEVVEVQGPIAEDCHLTVSSLVAAQSVDESSVEGPTEVVTGGAHRTGDAITDNDTTVPNWWESEYGAITSSRVQTTDSGTVIAGDITASDITTNTLMAVGTLSIRGDDSITAERIHAGRVELNESRAMLGSDSALLSRLIVFGQLLGSGSVGAGKVVVHGGLQGGTDGRLRISTAGELWVSGVVQEADLTAETVNLGSFDRNAHSEPAEDCAIRLTGSGASTVRAGSGVRVEVAAARAETDVEIHGTVDFLSICHDNRSFIRLRGDADIRNLRCDGVVALGVPQLSDCHVELGLGTDRVELSLERIVGYNEEIGEPSTWSVCKGALGSDGVFHLALAGSDPRGTQQLTIRSNSGASAWGALIASDTRSPEVRIHGADEEGLGGDLDVAGPVVARLVGLTTVASLLLQAHPATDLRGNRSERAGAPILFLSPDSDVASAVGPMTLGLPHRGRLHGIERSADEGTLRIVGIERADSAIDSDISGVLIDADVTGLHFSELEGLGTIEVVDPLPAPLRELARFSFVGHRDRAELRRRAEWSSTLLSTLARQAVSGESRAALHWSSARLHHGALSARRPEFYARFVHRFLGYSWRPSSAVLTYLLVAATLVGTRILRDRHIGIERPLSLVVGDVFTLPLGFVRLPASELLFFNRALNVLATVVLAIPLVFIVISVRNFLRTPNERD